MFNIKTSIDEVFCFGTTLRVLDVDPNYCYVRFERSINNSKIEDEGNIFKYVSIFNYYFHNIYSDRKISIFDKIRYI